MKRIFSILMCGLLFYNMMGFSLVYWAEEYASLGKIKHHSSAKRPAADEYIVVKIPVSLPYQTNWQVAEPAEGRLRNGDDFYQIIEQQLLNDTLRVLCKLDSEAGKRFSSLADHIRRHIEDDPGDTSNKSSNLLKNFLKDYLNFNRKHLFFIVEWTVAASIPTDLSCLVNLPFFSVHSPPPNGKMLIC